MNAARKSVAQTPPPSMQQQLDHAVVELDQLIGEVRLGVRDQTHFDALEERAQNIAGCIRGAFRRPR